MNIFAKLLIIALGITTFIGFEYNREEVGSIVISSVHYIMGNPFGIKQSSVVKKTLGGAYLSVLEQRDAFDVISGIRICCCITFTVYRYTFHTLVEIIHLLNNRTYNPRMKRYDLIYIGTDQTVLAGMIFSILSILYLNLLIFYLFFVAVFLILEIIIYIQLLAENIVINGHIPNILGEAALSKGILNRILNGKLANLNIHE